MCRLCGFFHVRVCLVAVVLACSGSLRRRVAVELDRGRLYGVDWVCAGVAGS